MPVLHQCKLTRFRHIYLASSTSSMTSYTLVDCDAPNTSTIENQHLLTTCVPDEAKEASEIIGSRRRYTFHSHRICDIGYCPNIAKANRDGLQLPIPNIL